MSDAIICRVIFLLYALMMFTVFNSNLNACRISSCSETDVPNGSFRSACILHLSWMERWTDERFRNSEFILGVHEPQ